MKRYTISLVAVGMFVALASGCAGRTAAWQEDTAQAGDGGDAAAPAEDAGDKHWEDRTSPDSIRKAIAAWEEKAAANPNDFDTLVKLTRAHYFLADGYLRSDDAAYLETMDKGVSWGEQALMAGSPEFAERMQNKEKFYEAVTVIPKEAVPAAYWYAAALGKWAKKKSFAVLIGQKDNVRATMETCLKLNPDYYHAGPDRYFGAFYAIAPAFAGGDLEKSQIHYDKSLEGAPYFIGTKVLMAENLAVKNDDEETFKKLLAEVLEADPNAKPEIMPEMKVEQAKAKELLDNIDEYF
jgi:tetratricopeptide (TPR) repeat protein